MSIKFVATRIKKAREERNISQKKLGLILGLSDKAISAYEAARTYPPLDTLFKLAKELKKPISYFTEEDTNKVSVQESIQRIDEKLSDISKEIESLKKRL